jgi:hypothetical protein
MRREYWCVSEIWSRKFYDPNDLEKRNQNYWTELIENEAISKAWTKWRQWSAAKVV